LPQIIFQKLRARMQHLESHIEGCTMSLA
jgi:hypothetical protein